jgi:thiosulfate dehydrogenase
MVPAHDDSKTIALLLLVLPLGFLPALAYFGVARLPAPPAAPVVATEGVGDAVVRAPAAAAIPDGPLGDAIRRGKLIVTQTYETLPEHVGSRLHCTSCHLEEGTRAGAAPWVGLTGVFPEYRARSGRVDTIERRVNDCFERSLNGTALDPAGDDMTAIVAYMGFISRGVPAGRTPPGRGFRRNESPPPPDRPHGAQVYAQRCASCHGADGEGQAPGGRYQFPPLVGDHSYTVGAGLARLDTAASFVRWNMPLGMGGTLSEQESYDVADFFIHQARPDFARRRSDWPRGGRPADAR